MIVNAWFSRFFDKKVYSSIISLYFRLPLPVPQYFEFFRYFVIAGIHYLEYFKNWNILLEPLDLLDYKEISLLEKK